MNDVIIIGRSSSAPTSAENRERSVFLITAVASPWHWACIAWCAMNVAFEVGQHPHISGRLAEVLHSGFGQPPQARTLANFFLHGTFDVGDIAATVPGALAAAAVLCRIQPEWESNRAR